MSIRWDSKGIFWEDQPPERRRGAERAIRNRPLPEIPDTGWRAPERFPRLDGVKILAIDTETRDPNIKTLGPGDCRGDGEVVGISLATEDAQWYFPIRHTIQPEHNMDPEKVLAWLRDTLRDHPALKVGHRLSYDLGWLEHEGVPVSGPFYDTAIAEALIDENKATYALDSLGLEYLGIGKEDEQLYDWCYRAYGGQQGRPQIANIWRAPPCLAGPYAEQDARLPLDIMLRQRSIIAEQGLDLVLSIEQRLIPLLHAMRRRGVRVNTQAAEELDVWLSQRVEEARSKFKYLAGFEFVDSNQRIARAFDAAGITYRRTAKDNPSFPKEWLEHHPSELARCIVDIRRWEKSKGTFIEGYAIKHAVNGRIHAEINQVRYAGDSQGDRGTIGRFSYTNPNLQNIPSRDPLMKRKVRGLFLPEEGDDWESRDYSQIEFRMLAHMAMGPGAEDVRQSYRDNPTTDYHVWAQDMVQAIAQIHLDRKPTKNLNFGMIFGMGKDKMIRSLGVNKDTALALYNAYHEALPFAKYTYDRAMTTAQNRGYIKTLLGRRRRYSMWESSRWDVSRAEGAFPYEVAREKYRGRIRRAFTNSALNNALQLSAADVIKKAMVEIYESGVCDILGVPLIQVHDELNFSRPRTQEAKEASAEVKRIMEQTVADRLSVPLLVSNEIGPDWGHLEEVEE